jgi:tetratricopeptide (TPR) repeat protein
MKRLRKKFSLALMAAVAVLVSSSFAQAAAVGDNSEVVASFIEHLDSLKDVDQSTKDKVTSAIKELGTDSSDAVTEGLLLIYPNYSAAVESSDNEDVAKAIDLLTPLAESTDKFLAADASFYLARTLMNSEQFEEALPRLKKLNRELVDFSAHQGSSQYFVGVAQAGMLKNREAIESFMQFIQFNPDAPERLRVSAWRQVQQLQAIEEGKLSDVHQHMDFSRRHLQLADTGDQTQKEQDDIVKMLGVLIKEQEKKECNSSCKKSGS